MLTPRQRVSSYATDTLNLSKDEFDVVTRGKHLYIKKEDELLYVKSTNCKNTKCKDNFKVYDAISGNKLESSVEFDVSLFERHSTEYMELYGDESTHTTYVEERTLTDYLPHVGLTLLAAFVAYSWVQGLLHHG